MRAALCLQAAAVHLSHAVHCPRSAERVLQVASLHWLTGFEHCPLLMSEVTANGCTENVSRNEFPRKLARTPGDSGALVARPLPSLQLLNTRRPRPRPSLIFSSFRHHPSTHPLPLRGCIALTSHTRPHASRSVSAPSHSLKGASLGLRLSKLNSVTHFPTARTTGGRCPTTKCPLQKTTCPL